MKRFSLIIVGLLSFASFAQLHTVGFHAGAMGTSLGSNFGNGDATHKIDFIGGLNYQYRFTSAFVLGGNLEYTQYGAKVPVDFYNVYGEYVATENSSWDWNYLSIPLIVGYEMGGKISFKPKAAIVPSILTRAVYNFQPYEGSTLSPYKDSYYSSAQKIDFGALIGLDVSARFHSGFVFASVDYRQSITTVNTDEYFPTSINDNYRNRGLALSMGVRFIIGKPEPEGPKDIIDNPVD